MKLIKYDPTVLFLLSWGFRMYMSHSSNIINENSKTLPNSGILVNTMYAS